MHKFIDMNIHLLMHMYPLIHKYTQADTHTSWHIYLWLQGQWYVLYPSIILPRVITLKTGKRGCKAPQKVKNGYHLWTGAEETSPIKIHLYKLNKICSWMWQFTLNHPWPNHVYSSSTKYAWTCSQNPQSQIMLQHQAYCTAFWLGIQGISMYQICFSLIPAFQQEETKRPQQFLKFCQL